VKTDVVFDNDKHGSIGKKKIMTNIDFRALQGKICTDVLDAAIQLCGGSHSSAELLTLVPPTISFSNKEKKVDDVSGKPHDVEIRIALSLYHRTRTQTKHASGSLTIEITSDYGLVRTVSSSNDLANLFVQILSQSWDVRSDNSGILCLVTEERSQNLRSMNLLPCPICVKWCKGEKGLWWHQQRVHGREHSQASEQASKERTILALIRYMPDEATTAQNKHSSSLPLIELLQKPQETMDIFEMARRGCLEEIQSLLSNDIETANTQDSKGSFPLHWASGFGHLSVVHYLVEVCKCDPNVGQRGKRSFSGRTPLHWAARNGHLDVVKYLVENCNVQKDATTLDGTSAFCWACWQGHLDVMMYLQKCGCDIHKMNSFGCNAALWCAQGQQNDIHTMKWLNSMGCRIDLINSNGHGTLHKAAQRGKADMVHWLVRHTKPVTFAWLGPDSDGCCPSDLAGMEGHVDLAMLIVDYEMQILKQLLENSHESIPDWLLQSGQNLHVIFYDWEPWGGVRRLQKYYLDE
jgi:ankyrin repeat protein